MTESKEQTAVINGPNFLSAGESREQGSCKVIASPLYFTALHTELAESGARGRESSGSADKRTRVETPTA